MERSENNGPRINFLAALVGSLVFLVFLFAVSSCSTLRKLFCNHQRDSVAVRYIDSLRVKDSLRIRDSLFLVPVPVEGSQNIFPSFMPSHLETSLAESDAYVDSLGLHHSLRNKDTSIGVHVPVTEHVVHEEHSTQKDSTHTKYVIKKVEIEKPLSKWKTAQIGAFWYLCGALALCLLWIFRKPLLKLLQL